MSIKRGMVIDLDLTPVKGSETGKIRPCIVISNNIINQYIPVIQVVPLTSWSEKKSAIRTNVVIEPTEENGLDKISVADCLQTRPVDYKYRLVKIRGQISFIDIEKINNALKLVFDLD